MARAAGIPVAVVSATDIVETGYRGLNVGDLLRPLYEAAGTLERLKAAALVVDEVDKLRMPTQYNSYIRRFPQAITVTARTSRWP